MSEDQIAKLTKYLTSFKKDVDKRFDSQDKAFEKMFMHMEKRFEVVDKNFEAVDKRFDLLTNIIDGYAAKIDMYAQEMAAMDHKINRLEKYIQILADNAGIDLDKINA